jgi:5-methyltetrahydrofolate--homocysteine methyltransferase
MNPESGGPPAPDLGWTEAEVLDRNGYRRAQRADRFPYLAALRERVLVYDGGTGTELFKLHLTAADFGGERAHGCLEALLATRPDVMPLIHRRFLEAGADVIETNSFGALPHVLAEFGLAARAEELATMAARTARQVADSFATTGRPRFVAGALGPGTKLISLGHIGWDELFASYRTAARGLVAGGADLLLIETCQDLLQVKCAVLATRAAMREMGCEVPLQVQVTVEATGQMLAGSDIATALTALEALPVDVVGMNCATGPDLMDPHVRHLGLNSTRWVSCMPNAGLPRNVDGHAVFDLTPAELAAWHVKFVRDYGVNAVGGCCGTGPEHVAAIAAAMRDLAPGRPRRDRAPAAIASLYQSVPLRQEAGLLIVGERTNATGSKVFRERLLADDWDGMVHLAQEQVAEGCHVLDVSVAWTGRDERRDMAETMRRFATAVTVPIMVDSTQPDVMELALQHLGGRAIINSVNLEDGEAKFDRVCALARRYGAALVALTIDEDREAGMAKTVARKVAIAERMYARITEKHGLPGSSVLFDLLTFPVTQGDEDTRQLARWTLEGIAEVKRRLPEAGFILGVSNVSFGLKPRARQVLNTVFLDEAVAHGLTAAILNAAKVVPLSQIPEAEQRLARDLIHDRRVFAADGACAYDPLFAFVARYTQADEIAPAAAAAAKLPLVERLAKRIVDGRKVGIEQDLDEAMAQGLAPLEIINRHLLAGMKTVGELFGAGKTQLPFVLQSAEAMKAAVKHLQPHLGSASAAGKGCLVLATVKGDVHDIGKNLVDIILTNNGYRVINLGIKQPLEAILAAVDEHHPDAIGMSGLLVKSTVVMRENLERLAASGCRLPVILGGAALNRAYVEQELRAIYPSAEHRTPDSRPLVWYAADAFDGLQLMDELCGHVPEGQRTLTTAAVRPPTHLASLAEKLARGKAYVPSGVPPAPRIPRPPFWGRRTVASTELDLKEVCTFINRNALFRGQWGLRQGQELSREEWQAMVRREAEPVLERLIETAARERLLQPAVAYGYFPCAAERNNLIVFDPETGAERCRFSLPRQMAEDGAQGNKGGKNLCIADFFRPRGSAPLGDEASSIPAAAWANGARDVLAAHCITMGAAASVHAQQLFRADNFREYLYFHGLSVESAEALAELFHQRIRRELGIADDDATTLEGLFTQGYQGSRYSFGYPACPRLEDQLPLQELLRWQEIGVTLSEEYQLQPEQSTSALIVHHPAAKYFSL